MSAATFPLCLSWMTTDNAQRSDILDYIKYWQPQITTCKLVCNCDRLQQFNIPELWFVMKYFRQLYYSNKVHFESSIYFSFYGKNVRVFWFRFFHINPVHRRDTLYIGILLSFLGFRYKKQTSRNIPRR